MPFYYSYQDPNPSTLTDPNQGHWENQADWPRTFIYTSAHDYFQGLHPAAPVYQSTQPPQTNMYYFPGNSASPAGYYYNGIYYGQSAPAATGWPSTSSSSHICCPYSTAPNAYPYPYNCSPYYTAQPVGMPFQSLPMPSPWCNTAATAQAAAALAMMPNAPAYFVGASPAEIQAQNSIIAANMAAQAGATQMPSQLVPYKPGASQQFWCKELDGSWTLREHNDVIMGELGNGHWERHPTSGYFYYIRHPA